MSALSTFGLYLAQIPAWPAAWLLLAKATALLMAAWFGHLALHGANPRWRVLLWRGAALALIVLPALQWAPSALEVPVEKPAPVVQVTKTTTPPPRTAKVFSRDRAHLPLDADGWSTGSRLKSVGRPESTGHLPVGVPVANSTLSDRAPSWTVSAVPWRRAALGVWIGGVLILGVRLILGYRFVARMARSAEPAPDWLKRECARVATALACRRAVDVRICAQTATPFLCGLRRTVLLLPPWMCRPADHGELPAVLAHELSHARSGDLAWNAWLHLPSIALWFHPLAWRVRAAHAAACEAASDAASAAFVGDVRAYCRVLARAALELSAAPPAAGVAMARSSEIMGRLDALRRCVFSAPLRRRRVIGCIMAGSMAALLVGGLRFVDAEPKDDKEPDLQSKAASEDRNERRGAPESSKQDTATKRVQVQVVDESGKAIANVSVSSVVNERPGADYVTDAHGQLTIEYAPTQLFTMRLDLNHRGYVTTQKGWWRRPGMPPLDLPAETTIRLSSGTTIGGVILNEVGDPIEDVRVVVDSDGEVNLRHGFDVAVYAETFSPRVVAVDVRPDAAPVEIKLQLGGLLDGQVVDEDGKPVAKGTIEVREWQASRSFPLMRSDLTDSDGRFRLRDLPTEGTFSIECQKQGYLHTEHPRLRAQREPCQFTLYRPIVVAGQVLDADSGKPIERFEVAEGHRWRDDRDFVFWHDRSEIVEAVGGHFQVTLKRSFFIPPDPLCALRISAPGYLPAETSVIRIGQPVEPVALRLERCDPITGIVLDPQERPVSEAEVAWVGPKRSAYIKQGRIQTWPTYRPERIVKTDSRGRFELPPSRDEGTLVVLHETGYAQRKWSKQEAASAIRLTNWARIEGVVKAGRQGVLNANVWLQPADGSLIQPDAPVHWAFNESTHIDGTFAFDYVPAIEFVAARYVAQLPSHAVTFTPEPGRTSQIQIGGSGSAIEGKLVEPEGLELAPFSDEFSTHIGSTQIAAYPLEQGGRDKRSRTNYMAQLTPDGAFRIDDLPPGRYGLSVEVHAPVPPDSCGLPVAIAFATRRFEIEVAGGDGPWILPPVELESLQGPRVGQAAPELKGQTLTGEAFDLHDLAGKPVLLDFWATWCGPCMAANPQLRELYDDFGRDGRIAFVGVNLDYTVEAAQRSTKDHELSWPQIAAGDWGEGNPVLRSFAVTSIPSFWLIGADGTVLARDIPLDGLESALEQAARP